MIKKYITLKSFLYKPYLYFRIFWLNKAFIKKKSYSQSGEDLVISKFFKSQKKGIYVDIGAYDPIKYNNTYLLYLKGWRGINIDLNRTSIDQFKIIRSEDHNVVSAISDKVEKRNLFIENIFSPLNKIDKNFNSQINNKKNGFIKTKRFDEIVKNKIDFLDIDIEGMDFKVLKSINLEFYKPKLINIEIFGKKKIDLVSKYLNSKNYHLLKKINSSYLFALKRL